MYQRSYLPWQFFWNSIVELCHSLHQNVSSWFNIISIIISVIIVIGIGIGTDIIMRIDKSIASTSEPFSPYGYMLFSNFHAASRLRQLRIRADLGHHRDVLSDHP
ncbi:hypothetical protein BJX76DRAFT_324974 [Aspergillus varians]